MHKGESLGNGQPGLQHLDFRASKFTKRKEFQTLPETPFLAGICQFHSLLPVATQDHAVLSAILNAVAPLTKLTIAQSDAELHLCLLPASV